MQRGKMCLLVFVRVRLFGSCSEFHPALPAWIDRKFVGEMRALLDCSTDIVQSHDFQTSLAFHSKQSTRGITSFIQTLASSPRIHATNTNACTEWTTSRTSHSSSAAPATPQFVAFFKQVAERLCSHRSRDCSSLARTCPKRLCPIASPSPNRSRSPAISVSLRTEQVSN